MRSKVYLHRVHRFAAELRREGEGRKENINQISLFPMSDGPAGQSKGARTLNRSEKVLKQEGNGPKDQRAMRSDFGEIRQRKRSY